MSNVVKFTMNNVPVGLDSMYVRVEEDVLTQGVRNVLYSGVAPVSGNAIEVNIGGNGVVGNGAIISADNYTSGGTAFKAMSGYGVIEAGAAPSLPSFDYDAVVVLGDSLTAQTFEYREVYFDEYAKSLGFAASMNFYGTGLSGHSTKTFTDMFVNGSGTTTPNRSLQDYKTLLAGKKVLFISMLGANDLRAFNDATNQAEYDQNFQTKKLEVETWTKTLRDSIVNATEFQAEFVISSVPYVDWRPDQTILDGDIFDIIDGNAPFYDQRDWQSDVVDGLCQTYSPDWFQEGRSLFDAYAITRNVFRYWMDTSEAVHPSVDSAYYIIQKFSKIMWDISNQTFEQDPLYPYPQESSFNVGDTAVVSFDRGVWSTSFYGNGGANINVSSLNQGIMSSSTLISDTGKDLGGRSFVRTDETAASGGKELEGNETPSLDNTLLLKTNVRASTGEVSAIKLEGLPTSSTFTLEVVSSSAQPGSLLINGSGGNIEIADTQIISAGDHKKGSTTIQSDMNGVADLTFTSTDGLTSSYVAGLSITRTA